MNKDWSRIISFLSGLAIVIMASALISLLTPTAQFFELDKKSFNVTVLQIVLIDTLPCVVGIVWLVINHYKKADLKPETEAEKKRRETLIKLMLFSMAIYSLSHLLFHFKH